MRRHKLFDVGQGGSYKLMGDASRRVLSIQRVIPKEWTYTKLEVIERSPDSVTVRLSDDSEDGQRRRSAQGYWD